MSPGKIALTIFGALVTLLALALVASGTVLVYAHTSLRDKNGYFSSGIHNYQSSGYAIWSYPVDLGTNPGIPNPGLPHFIINNKRVDSFTLHVTSSQANKPIFVGIGPDGAILRYLKGVKRSRVSKVQLDPFKVTYVPAGSKPPTRPPSTVSFWTSKTAGTGTQTITVPKENPLDNVVIMNADGSKGVSVDISTGVKLGWLLLAGEITIGVGIVLLILGIFMVVRGLRRVPFDSQMLSSVARIQAMKSHVQGQAKAIGAQAKSIGASPTKALEKQGRKLLR